MEATAVTPVPVPATTAGASDSAPPDGSDFAAALRDAASVRSPRPVTLGQMLGALAAGPGVAAAARPLGADGLATAAAAAGTAAGAVGDGLDLDAIVPGRLSSGFGMRTHPITGEHKMHSGVDVAAPAGTPIRAAGPGVVSFAGTRGGYGLLVIVDHGEGVETRYAHQQRLDVRAGDRVGAGQVLGTVGATGLATGPHLHFELRRDGTAVDPTRSHTNGETAPWTT